jgi:hypothetical protein
VNEIRTEEGTYFIAVFGFLVHFLKCSPQGDCYALSIHLELFGVEVAACKEQWLIKYEGEIITVKCAA